MSKPLWAAVMLVMLCLGTAMEARAESPEERANTLYKRGKAQILEGELAEAEALFTRAWANFKHPLIMKKRAEVRERRANIEGALADYRTYLEVLRGSARKERRLIMDRIAALDALLVVPVKTTVIASVSGTLVSVDGAEAKATPFSLKLIPGPHVFRVRDARFVSSTSEHAVVAANPGFVRIAVEYRRARVSFTSDEPTLGGITLRVDEDELVLTDNERQSATISRNLTMGSHRLLCSRGDDETVALEFSVRLNQENVVRCAFDTDAGAGITDPWGWVAVGLAAASIGTGVAFLVSWGADVELAEARNQRLESTKHIAGGVLLGAGVALAIGSYFVFTRETTSDGEPSGQTTMVSPFYIDGESNGASSIWGLGATGRF